MKRGANMTSEEIAAFERSGGYEPHKWGDDFRKFPWTPEAVERLIAARHAGQTWESIGRIFGLSRGAVRLKYWNLQRDGKGSSSASVPVMEPEPRSCNGLCLTGADIGVPEGKGVAYPRPECPVHTSEVADGFVCSRLRCTEYGPIHWHCRCRAIVLMGQSCTCGATFRGADA